MANLFMPIVGAMRRELLSGGYIQADETPVDVQSGLEAEAKAAGLGAAERLGLRREKAESIVAGLKEGIESARASTPPSSATRPFFSRSLHRSISTTFSKPRKKCGGSIRSLFKFIASSSASLQTKNRESSGHISH
jgi:hypothetical protein